MTRKATCKFAGWVGWKILTNQKDIIHEKIFTRNFIGRVILCGLWR